MGVYRFSARTEYGWMNGEALNEYTAADGQYEPSAGVDIFRDPGVLRAGYVPTSIGGATVTDNILDMFVIFGFRGSSTERQVIGYGDGGKLYGITISTNTPNLIATITNPARGLQYHKDYAYYARTTTVGRYGNLSSTGPSTTDSYLTSLTGTVKSIAIPHPMDSWGGFLYVGDVNVIKRVLGSESPGTTGSSILTLDDQEIVTAIGHSQTSLLFGTTTDPGPMTGVTPVNSKAVFYTWNGVDRNPTAQFVFPEPQITCIKTLGSDVFVFGVYSVYRFDGIGFIPFVKLGNRVGSGGADFSRRGFAWKDSNKIRIYGTNDASLAPVLYTPFTGTGTTVNALCWAADEKLYVADNNGLYSLSTGNDSPTFTSRFIPLSQEEQVSEIRIYTDGNMASGDDYDIKIITGTNTTYEVASHDFATLGAVASGTYRPIQFTTGMPFMTGFKLGIDFNNSATGLREVVVITQKTAQP